MDGNLQLLSVFVKSIHHQERCRCIVSEVICYTIKIIAIVENFFGIFEMTKICSQRFKICLMNLFSLKNS